MHVAESQKRKIVVALYSMDGHTEKVAGNLADKLDAGLIRILPLKEEGRATQAMKAALGLKSAIKPCRTDLSDIDFLVVACPVWAKKMPPYMNRYLSMVKNVRGKPFSVLGEMRESGAEATIAQVRKALEKKGMRFVSSTYTLQDEVEAGRFREKIASFADGITRGN
jgi:flavodoxin